MHYSEVMENYYIKVIINKNINNVEQLLPL